MLNRSKTWALLLLTAAFLAGAVVGSDVRSMWLRGEPSGGRHGPDRMLAALTRELALTPGQHDSVGAILQNHWARMNAVWDTVLPRFDSIRADMDSQVVRHLTPEQAAKYREHVSRYRHRQEPGRLPTGGRP